MPWKTTNIILVLTILFLVLPFIVIVGASFDTGGPYQIRFPPRGISSESYSNISPVYVSAFQKSIILGAVVAVISTALGLAAAIGIVRGPWFSKNLLNSFFRLPIQIPLVVSGAVFLNWFYQVWSITGVNLMSGLVGLAIAHVFIALPYTVGACGAVLARLDESLEEAAAGLGASNWTIFWTVTFPAIRPGVMVGAFYAFIVSFGDVPVSVFLVTGDTMTLPVRIFQDMVFDLQPSMFAVATIVAILSFAMILFVQKVLGLDLVLPARKRS